MIRTALLFVCSLSYADVHCFRNVTAENLDACPAAVTNADGVWRKLEGSVGANVVYILQKGQESQGFLDGQAGLQSAERELRKKIEKELLIQQKRDELYRQPAVDALIAEGKLDEKGNLIE